MNNRFCITSGQQGRSAEKYDPVSEGMAELEIERPQREVRLSI